MFTFALSLFAAVVLGLVCNSRYGRDAGETHDRRSRRSDRWPMPRR